MNITPLKAVRIMAEYASDGIWHVPFLPRETLSGFRISPGLYARLQRWVERYAELERADGLTGERANPEWPEFDREGYAIAFAVKAELPDWRVFYVDEALLDQPIVPMSLVEIPNYLL